MVGRGVKASQTVTRFRSPTSYQESLFIYNVKSELPQCAHRGAVFCPRALGCCLWGLVSRYGRWPSIYCPRVSSRGRLKPPRPKPGGVTTRRMDVVYSNTTIRYATVPAMRSNAHIPQIPTSHPHGPQPQPQPTHGHHHHQPTLAPCSVSSLSTPPDARCHHHQGKGLE